MFFPRLQPQQQPDDPDWIYDSVHGYHKKVLEFRSTSTATEFFTNLLTNQHSTTITIRAELLSPTTIEVDVYCLDAEFAEAKTIVEKEFKLVAT
jgi:hypothetical protein